MPQQDASDEYNNICFHGDIRTILILFVKKKCLIWSYALSLLLIRGVFKKKIFFFFFLHQHTPFWYKWKVLWLGESSGYKKGNLV